MTGVSTSHAAAARPADVVAAALRDFAHAR